MSRFSDTELFAYIDHQLSEDRVKDIERHAELDEELQATIAILRFFTGPATNASEKSAEEASAAVLALGPTRPAEERAHQVPAGAPAGTPPIRRASWRVMAWSLVGVSTAALVAGVLIGHFVIRGGPVRVNGSTSALDPFGLHDNAGSILDRVEQLDSVQPPTTASAKLKDLIGLFPKTRFLIVGLRTKYNNDPSRDQDVLNELIRYVKQLDASP
jgi:hypothetical protein